MSGSTAWRGRRVLVTGATGIVGSWVVKGFLERGATVVAHRVASGLARPQ